MADITSRGHIRSRQVPKKIQKHLLSNPPLRESEKIKYLDIVNTYYPSFLPNDAQFFFKHYSLYYLRLLCPFRVYLGKKSNIFAICDNITIKDDTFQFIFKWKGYNEETETYYAPTPLLTKIYNDLFKLGLYDTRRWYIKQEDELPSSRRWDGYRSLYFDAYPYNLQSLEKTTLRRYSLHYLISRDTRSGFALPAAIREQVDVIESNTQSHYSDYLTDNLDIYNQPEDHLVPYYEPTPSLFPIRLENDDVEYVLTQQRERMLYKAQEVYNVYIQQGELAEHYLFI